MSKPARGLEAAGLVGRAADPSDTRTVQLSLKDEGHAVTGRTVEVVHRLVNGPLAPLGALDGPDATAFDHRPAARGPAGRGPGRGGPGAGRGHRAAGAVLAGG